MEVLDYRAENQIVVSQDYIQQDTDGRRFVFTAQDVDEETVARKTYIETGETYNNRAVVQSGLQPGDRIITNGSRGLADGQPIALSQSPQEAGAPENLTNNG